ncbi:cell division cycle protein 20 homolog [Lingula anatina]|uniref:Cell division cycle protein 20 homolog n=1 Tax=Lingula anatina TaxID=7574 RepID=A0A1S3ICJ1_LINAN|nr:cell division cycle protein 20 homolog [Lingula anatina]|eukprot:XP_013395888.1 cell division cycle protein 20 homolog [Lingula anatina]
MAGYEHSPQDYSIFGAPRSRAGSVGAKIGDHGVDRMLPRRGSLDVDLSHFKLMTPPTADDDNSDDKPSVFVHKTPPTDSKQTGNGCQIMNNYHQKFRRFSLGGGRSDGSILPFSPMENERKTTLSTPVNYLDSVRKRLEGISLGSSPSSSSKVRERKPDQILDMPNIRNDLNVNVMDWSSQNMIGIALEDQVYCWRRDIGECIQVPVELTEEDDYVMALGFNPDGSLLALGSTPDDIEIWNLEKMKVVHNIRSHSCAAVSLAWKGTILASGDADGNIHLHDTRAPTPIATNKDHTWVCNLRFSPDGRYLASGGKDSTICIREMNERRLYQKIPAHNSAVRALTWCTGLHSILASGGELGDGSIRLWNVNSGLKLTEVDTDSGITCMLWNTNDQELITGHRGTKHNLVVWKNPSQLHPALYLDGEEEGILHVALSPNEETLASASPDEKMRLWNCFGDANIKKKQRCCLGSPTTSALLRTIR